LPQHVIAGFGRSIVILRCEGEARASKDDSGKPSFFEAHSLSLVRTSG
jgi:hypothetical protein